MSVLDITDDSMVAAVAAGHDTHAALGRHFGAICTPGFTLARTVDRLLTEAPFRLHLDDTLRLRPVGHTLPVEGANDMEERS